MLNKLSLGLLLPVMALPMFVWGQGRVEPLSDPIPEAIPQSDFVVAAVPFVRMPRTMDSVSEGNTNAAYARIQYLYPVPDGSGRLAINDLRGLLYLTDESGRQPRVYLDLREQNVGFDDSTFPNETGLLGFAFHPQFDEPGTPGYGKFYTSYSATVDSGIADYLENPDNDHESVITEWTSDDPGADRFSGSHRELFRIGQFDANHNIATLAFNPAASAGDADFGMLYFSLGDGGGANDPYENGQSLADPMSTISRIDPRASGSSAYAIPPDNPFVGQTGVAPEIWAYGIRHAQHFSFDTNGTMYISDIGQSQIEEINIGVPGANYGWRLREGTFATGFGVTGGRPGPVYPRPEDAETFEYPVAQYDHTPSNAVSSGFVYRGQAIPALYGKFLFTDMVTGRVFFIDTANLEADNPAPITELRISIDGNEQNLADAVGFPNTYYSGNRADIRLGIDSNGELYLLSKGDGWVRQLRSAN
ncbi:MAG: PQQ-dependent sugar dehydrogenase [Pseudomonadales bacterium]|nr:PQQ-dependent sugar dehydrogenase [Pseudomonadales bacterium]